MDHTQNGPDAETIVARCEPLHVGNYHLGNSHGTIQLKSAQEQRAVATPPNTVESATWAAGEFTTCSLYTPSLLPFPYTWPPPPIVGVRWNTAADFAAAFPLNVECQNQFPAQQQSGTASKSAAAAQRCALSPVVSSSISPAQPRSAVQKDNGVNIFFFARFALEKDHKTFLRPLTVSAVTEQKHHRAAVSPKALMVDARHAQPP